VRVAAALALLAAGAAVGPAAADDDGVVLVAVRDDTTVRQEPPRTTIEIDLFAPDRRIGRKQVTVRDEAMRKRLLHEAFLHVASADYGYLVAEERGGFRCLRVSLAVGEEIGNSFLVAAPGADQERSPPLFVSSERIAFLAAATVQVLDLRLGTFGASALPATVVAVDPVAKRAYFAGEQRVEFVPFDPNQAPGPVTTAPQPLFELPARWRPQRVAVSRDGERVAYLTRERSRREDADRTVLVVTDRQKRTLVQRSLPGRGRDLRWHGARRLVVTTTAGETFSIHRVDLETGEFATLRLPPEYLSPPTFVPRQAVSAP